jgi:hypothetical protein
MATPQAGPPIPKEVGCFLESTSCHACRCLALCFGGRCQPSPCTCSPFRHEAPNHKSDALKFQPPKAFTPVVMPLGAFKPLLPLPPFVEAPQYGTITACRHVAARLISNLARARIA